MQPFDIAEYSTINEKVGKECKGLKVNLIMFLEEQDKVTKEVYRSYAANHLNNLIEIMEKANFFEENNILHRW